MKIENKENRFPESLDFKSRVGTARHLERSRDRGMGKRWMVEVLSINEGDRE